MYQYYKERIGVCDAEIEKQLQQYEASRNEGLIEAPKSDAKDLTRIKKTKDKNHPSFDVRGYLQRIHGVDVLNIYGFSETGGLEVLEKPALT